MRGFRLALLSLILGTATPLLAEEGGGLGKALITPQVGTLFWTVVTFLILAFLLAKFAWKPLLGAIDERERSIRESVDHARLGREEAEALLEQHRQLVAEARRERAEALAAGQRDAERVKDEILAEARSQREQVMRQTQAQVAASMRQARDELKSAVADLAIKAAEQLLTQRLDDAGDRRLVEEYLADLERTESGGGSPPS